MVDGVRIALPNLSLVVNQPKLASQPLTPPTETPVRFVMLATLVIGLREGLEASLIVGIIAAFLSRTGKPLRPMWIGVAIAVVLSIAVGVVLELVSVSLPQAQQEGMESIIGLVAVTFVTAMIGWMNTHARHMRSELEGQAESALRDGTAWALVGMAFLAVLKEGFETSVFILAAFQSASNTLAAGAGALIGVGIAVAIGIGIFRGGVRINLGRFFKITGVFLVFVAAGLVLTSLRTAHEAGWITVGQQSTLDLSWLAPVGSVQAALLTGVLGIPADPRMIEVVGWVAFLIPTLSYLLWPAKKRPTPTQLPRLRFAIAAALAFAAAALAVGVQLPGAFVAPPASVKSSDGSAGTAIAHVGGSSATLTSQLQGASDTTVFPTGPGLPSTVDGVASRSWSVTTKRSVAKLPTTLSLTELISLNDGRLPIGVNAIQGPGPFSANWVSKTATSMSTVDGTLVAAQQTPTTILTLSGGGLSSARTISAAGVTGSPASWQVTDEYTAAALGGIANRAAETSELLLWKLWVPVALALAALVLVGFALKRAPREVTAKKTSPAAIIPNTQENHA
jgi:high-affinity iron transporter